MRKIRLAKKRGEHDTTVLPDGSAFFVQKVSKGGDIAADDVLPSMNRTTSNVTQFVPHLLIKRAQARNLIAKQSVEAGSPTVGIFWVLPGNDVIAQPTSLETALDYGGYKTSPNTHYETWNLLQRHAYDQPNVRDYEYEYWPRGRINFHIEERVFYLYADRKILESDQAIKKVMREFSLPSSNTKMGTDPHYQSSGDIGGTRKVPTQVILTLRTTYDDGETHDTELAGMVELRKHLAKYYHVEVEEWNAIRDELAEGQEVELSGDRLQITKQEKRQIPMTGRTVLPEAG